MYSFGSLYKTFAILFSVEMSDASIPNEIVSTTPSELKIFIAPSAKFSALEMLYTVGSSITKSTPLSKAILAFTHLFTIDVLPLCTKFPEITATIY